MGGDASQIALFNFKMQIVRLIILLGAAQLGLISVAFSQVSDLKPVKARIAELLKEKIEVYDQLTKAQGTPKDISVLEEKIEFRIRETNCVYHFSDLADDSIKFKLTGTRGSLEMGKLIFTKNLTGRATYGLFDELRKNLILIQNQQKAKIDQSRHIEFEQQASAYRSMKNKPSISEAQRKFIVQANFFSQEKNYSRAIEFYRKAIAADQVAYPAAYSNVALLYAQVNDFSAAISSMKKYLLLEPDGADARSAQDKIYEWEAMIGK
jgi:tetratricopeptide (TPR) repeat protein